MSETPKQPSRDIPPNLLNSLSTQEQDLLQRVLKHHPMLTPEEALEALREAGM